MRKFSFSRLVAAEDLSMYDAAKCTALRQKTEGENKANQQPAAKKARKLKRERGRKRKKRGSEGVDQRKLDN